MVALSAEELLQVVVGRRQAGNLQVVEQAGAVAVGDLEEAVDGIAQGAAGIPAVAPSVEQAGVARLDVIGRTPGRVLQDPGRGMDPAEAPPDVRPQRPGPLQTLGEQGPQLLQLRWQISPFSSIRPRLASIASKRSCSRSPAASSGGRPSSVRVLRTAAQYPCTTRAASSIRPSTVRSIGRTPRTIFFNSFLACRSASKIGRAASRRSWKWHNWCGTSGQTLPTASRIECWPSLTTPTTGTPIAASSAATSRSRPARSGQTATPGPAGPARTGTRGSPTAPRDRRRADDRQDRPALALQGRAMRRRPGRGGDQLVVALEQDATLADRHAAPAQLLVDFRNAAVLTVA